MRRPRPLQLGEHHRDLHHRFAHRVRRVEAPRARHGAEWDAARQALLGRIGDIEADDDEVNLPDVSNLHKAWATMSIEQKRLVIAAFVERVVVTPGRRGRRPNGVSAVDERVQIHWR